MDCGIAISPCLCCRAGEASMDYVESEGAGGEGINGDKRESN